MKYIGVLFVVAVALASNVQAEIGDGNRLLERCRPAMAYLETGKATSVGVENINAGFCIGYIAGMKDGLLMGMYAAKEQRVRGLGVCIPELGIENSQAVRIVMKYLNDHSNKLHEPDLTLVVKAFQEAYPCKSSGQ